MAILPLRVTPDPILRLKAKRVRAIDSYVKRLAEDMVESMHEYDGVGIAAPQVGVSLRVIVIGIPDQEIITLINPEIVRKTGQRDVNEGCLSIPGFRGEIKRAETVVARGMDLNGKELRIKASELLAQALEHEVGHIQGSLYTDLLESMDKLHKYNPAEKDEERSGPGPSASTRRLC